LNQPVKGLRDKILPVEMPMGTFHQKLTLNIFLDILLINFSFVSEFSNSEILIFFLRFFVLLFSLKNKSQYFVKTACVLSNIPRDRL
jgi:hypothetical protein